MSAPLEWRKVRATIEVEIEVRADSEEQAERMAEQSLKRNDDIDYRIVKVIRVTADFPVAGQIG